jgi:hypothetical protein
MLVWPSWRRMLTARLRREAMSRGRVLVRPLESSSRNVRSRTWCSRFSMSQWPLIQVASSVQVASKMLGPVIR